jgi:hypothetical protein
LIDIAHPDDRRKLVEQAKEKQILLPDQIFLSESAHLYPMEIATESTFKGGPRRASGLSNLPIVIWR